jgi:Trk K+ transport system NAD-binding subunit
VSASDHTGGATRAVVSGPDADGLGAALAAIGVEVVHVDGVPTRETLTDAGIDEADVFVLTAMEDATAIAVAREANPDVRVVTYARESLPEFARAQADLAVDPALLEAAVVAEELV